MYKFFKCTDANLIYGGANLIYRGANLIYAPTKYDIKGDKI